VAAVWDHESARAEKRAGELQAPVVRDLSKIWSDATIPAVIICSETNRHEELVNAAAQAKKHLFVEKPLGFRASDATSMADAIERAGVLFQTGYFRRSDPAMRFIREQIQKGRFGRITRMYASNCHGGALGGWFDTEWRWMADPKIAGCGGFGDLGTHVLDLLLWFGGEVERVTAIIDNGTARYPGCDEYGQSMMQFKKEGTIGTVAAGWDDVANPVEMVVAGTEGHATIIKGQLFFQSKHVEGADGKSPWTALPAPMGHAFELFLDAIGGKKDVPLVTAREAAYRSVVMEAMYHAAKERQWIDVPKMR
jgi:predicted dehydrogenase